MQQDLLQTDMKDKTEAARRFLEEALADFRKGRLQEAAEKMTVSGTLVREMIGFIKWEELNRPGSDYGRRNIPAPPRTSCNVV